MGNHFATYLRAERGHPDFGNQSKEWKLYDDGMVIDIKGGFAEIIENSVKGEIQATTIFFEKVPREVNP
jgi:hypothetical protein